MASSSSSPLAAAPAAPTTLLGALALLCFQGADRAHLASTRPHALWVAPAAGCCSGLPSEVLGQRIVAHPDLDAATRLALFRTSHALARMVLLHAPGSKRLTVDGSKGWSGALLHLLGTRWQPLPLADLELKVTSSLPPSLPAAISQHVSHLHLHQCAYIVQNMTAWRLHDTAPWPHLQHLTVNNCPYGSPPGAATSQLQPIPHLRFITWHAIDMPWGGDSINVLGLLAANATHARLDGQLACDMCGKMLQHLQQLTHCHMQRIYFNQEVQALLQHPTLEHVTVGHWYPYLDLQPITQPCRWRTLTVLGATHVRFLGMLPLDNLERLIIRGGFSTHPPHALEQVAMGVASLQQLHSDGSRLVLLPHPDAHLSTIPWKLQRGSGLFSLEGDTPSSVMALLQLVLEAGQGINSLELGHGSLTYMQLREEVAPLLQHSGHIHTLCFTFDRVADEDWCGSLLGDLPPCITHVKVDVFMGAQVIMALVLGGLTSLLHPLKLTLLHQGEISPTLKAKLLKLAAGRESLLTLEVVRKVW